MPRPYTPTARQLRRCAACVAAVLVLSAAATPAQPHRLTFLGDSLTSCSRVSRDFTSAQLSFRRPLWQAVVAANRDQCVTVVGPRHGCNARVDANLEAETNAFPKPHDSFFGRTLESVVAEGANSVLSQKSTVAVVWLGINDLQLGKPPEPIVSQLRWLVAKLLGTGTQHVLLLTLPTLDVARGGKHKRKFAATNQGVVEVNAAIKKAPDFLGKGRHGLPNAAELIAAKRLVVVDVAAGYDPVRHTYDGLHPNDEGEAHVAAAVATALLPLLVPDADCSVKAE